MICETYEIHVNGSGGQARLNTYLISPSDEIAAVSRPLILICPGGGYRFVSDREAEMFALQWNAYGFHAAVLYYSVAPAVYPTALTELGRSMQIIRENAKKWHVDADKILVEGSSAGGHLAASLGMFWKRPFLSEELGTSPDMLRPSGMILNYPVITSGVYAHEDSFRALCILLIRSSIAFPPFYYILRNDPHRSTIGQFFSFLIISCACGVDKIRCAIAGLESAFISLALS